MQGTAYFKNFVLIKNNEFLTLEKIKKTKTTEDADNFVNQLKEYANTFGINHEYFQNLKRKNKCLRYFLWNCNYPISVFGIVRHVQTTVIEREREQKYYNSIRLMQMEVF